MQNRGRKGKTLTENWRDLQRKGTHTQKKLIWNILKVTDIFLNQKRVNVCEHTAKMVSLEFLKGATRGCKRGRWGRGAIFTMYSHNLLSSDRERHLWLLKYIKFLCVYVCMYFHTEISSLFGNSFPFLFYLLSYPYFGTFCSESVYLVPYNWEELQLYCLDNSCHFFYLYDSTYLYQSLVHRIIENLLPNESLWHFHDVVSGTVLDQHYLGTLLLILDMTAHSVQEHLWQLHVVHIVIIGNHLPVQDSNYNILNEWSTQTTLFLCRTVIITFSMSGVHRLPFSLSQVSED